MKLCRGVNMIEGHKIEAKTFIIPESIPLVASKSYKAVNLSYNVKDNYFITQLIGVPITGNEEIDNYIAENNIASSISETIFYDINTKNKDLQQRFPNRLANTVHMLSEKQQIELAKSLFEMSCCKANKQITESNRIMCSIKNYFMDCIYLSPLSYEKEDNIIEDMEKQFLNDKSVLDFSGKDIDNFDFSTLNIEGFKSLQPELFDTEYDSYIVSQDKS